MQRCEDQAQCKRWPCLASCPLETELGPPRWWPLRAGGRSGSPPSGQESICLIAVRSGERGGRCCPRTECTGGLTGWGGGWAYPCPGFGFQIPPHLNTDRTRLAGGGRGERHTGHGCLWVCSGWLQSLSWESGGWGRGARPRRAYSPPWVWVSVSMRTSVWKVASVLAVRSQCRGAVPRAVP